MVGIFHRQGLGLGRDASGWSGGANQLSQLPAVELPVWAVIIQGSLIPCHTVTHVCLLQEIHLFGSCWGLINGYGFCDPVINSFSHNCLKTKQCIRISSPPPHPHFHGLRRDPAVSKNWFSPSWFFFFLPFSAFFFSLYRSRI